MNINNDLAGSQYLSNPVRSAGLTPHHRTSAWKAVPWFIIAIICLIMCSCSTTRQIEVIDRVSHDTLYLNKVQYDSIFVSQDHFVDRSSDTIYIRDVSVQYKYKLLRDTTFIHQVDSIPVIKEIEVTKEVLYIPWWSKALSWVGGIVILFFIIWLAAKLIFKL